MSNISFLGGNTNNVDTVKLNNLKEKLKVTREEYAFWKEVRDDKWYQEKLKSVVKLEDAIEKLCDTEDN